MIFNERNEQVKSYLGKTVAVKIDRPLGSAHPKYSDMIYPVNYGYIPGVIGGDGEALDVYVLAVGQPLTEFTGRVIGIVHRENDIEDKLVAAPDGVKFNQAEIAEAVYFQEQYYQISTESIFHKSCGVVICRNNNGKTEYLLLLQRKSQTWSFPKGHMEAGETEEQTALREVLEEVGIKATLLSGFREDVTYSISDSMEKTVVLFLSAATSDPIIRESEIVESQWLDGDQAKTLLYPEYYEILDKVEAYLKNRPI